MKIIMSRLIYTLFLWLLLPYIFIRLAWRGRKQPDYWRHWGERFGFYPARTDNQPLIWLHAVSVGETRATVSLVAQLRAAYPQHQILFTHTTPTGRDTSVQLYGDAVQRVYLPYDYPFAVRRFLRHFRPQLGILMETEIWVNLIHAAARERVPLVLLNARMSAKSARGYARFSALVRPALQGFTAIAAQTADDAERLQRLGASKVSIMGNLKFDIQPPAAQLALGQSLRQQFGAHRRIFLAASTREGEETLLLAAYAALPEPRPLLVIVPRHPQRFADVATLIRQHGLRCQRRSLNQAVPAEVEVVLGDSMGELFAYYAAADVAYIGGSLLPFGGQNLIEACAVGTPVLIGQHTYNFADASRLAVECGAAWRVQDADELFATALTLLNNPATLAEQSQRARHFVTRHQGASQRAMTVIESVLPR